MIRRLKYSVIDEDVFDILTPEACYWIGFITADGHLFRNPSKKITIRLAYSELKHLEKWNKFTKFNRVYIDSNMKAARVTLTNDKLYNKLIEFGLCERKSYIDFSIENEYITDSRDFWRGVIDGDGSLSYDYKNITLCGNHTLLTQFKEFVDKYVNNYNYSSGVNLSKNQTIYRIVYSGLTATKLIEVLYDNAEIYLDRKYEIARKIINEYEKYINI